MAFKIVKTDFNNQLAEVPNYSISPYILINQASVWFIWFVIIISNEKTSETGQ
jgi:hypothetical protein